MFHSLPSAKSLDKGSNTVAFITPSYMNIYQPFSVYAIKNYPDRRTIFGINRTRINALHKQEKTPNMEANQIRHSGPP
jgi:hypothetical protein